MDRYFRPAGDLPSKSVKEEIDDYILAVVSGKKYEAICELGTLCGGGITIVSFNKFKDMVDNGYNIINAKYINNDMIEVEFQQFRKDKIGERRR